MAQISFGNPFYHKEGEVGCKWPLERDHGGVIRTFSARGGGGLINYLPALPATVRGAYDPESDSQPGFYVTQTRLDLRGQEMICQDISKHFSTVPSRQP